jgi:hypothetical protein
VFTCIPESASSSARLVALGLANGGVSPIMLIGCALVVWGLVAVASARRSR